MDKQNHSHKRICVAQITGPHGVRGLVKLKIFAENLDLIDGQALYRDETGAETITVTLKNPQKQHYLAAIDGVTSREDVDAIKGTKLYTTRDKFPDPEEDEIYYEDLIGMNVEDENGEKIGTVTSVENYGASDLLDIKPATGPSFLLPYSDESIIAVNHDVITIRIPEGLLDDQT